jgi:hypothetical protein
MVQLPQGITRPLFNIMLGVEMFCGIIWFFENFTLCDLNNFDVILGNTFVDAYEINILRNVQVSWKFVPKLALSQWAYMWFIIFHW